MLKRKSLFYLVWLLLLPSCEDLFDIHPYDSRFDGETNINRHNIERIGELCAFKDTLRVAFISDTHGWLSDTKDEVNDINRRSDSIDFVIHCGDLTEEGVTKEFVWAKDRLSKLKVPYVTLIGNHDFLGTGEDTYKKMFGDVNFVFNVGRLRFICLNTNAAEYDYAASVPDFVFLESQVADSLNYDRSILVMHAPPFNSQFNRNVEKPFRYYVDALKGIMFCVNGHEHDNRVKDLYENGLIYYGIDCAEHRNYAIFTITPNGYQYENVRY